MVRSIRGRKCHVSLQSQSILYPADVEGTLSPAHARVLWERNSRGTEDFWEAGDEERENRGCQKPPSREEG